MDFEIILTADGSDTLFSKSFNEMYHSRLGALRESSKIFIEYGLQEVKSDSIRIFELGLGTGLNALLSYLYAEVHHIKINYRCIELFPLSDSILLSLNYVNLIAGSKEKFYSIHQAVWGEQVELSPYFSIDKIMGDVIATDLGLNSADLVYFDAFSPGKQPELWTLEIFCKMFRMLRPGGVLVTYCSKSLIRQRMKDAGFDVKKLPGPPGKREIVKAIKPCSLRSHGISGL